MGYFSFYPVKDLGATGEGGGITTTNGDYASHLERLRNQGSSEKYYHQELSLNMGIGKLEGAAFNVKLKYIEGWNNNRLDIAKIYQEVITNPKVTLQDQPDFSDSVYHLFVITSDDRNGFIKHLNDNDVFPGMHYPVPCHLRDAYASLGHKRGDFPNSEHLADNCLSLPMFAELDTADAQRVVEVVNS